MADVVVESYTAAGLDPQKAPGTIARVTDSWGGLWMKTGTQWAPLLPAVDASLFSGADAGILLQAAIDSLPETGGVVDARAIAGAQFITTELKVGGRVGTISKSVTLLLGNATFTLMAAGRITMGPGSQLIGSGTNGAATLFIVGWDTNGITIDFSKGYTPGATEKVATGCVLANFRIQTNASGNSSTGKALIRVTDSPGNMIENVNMAHLHTNGYGLLIEGTTEASPHIGPWFNQVRGVGCIYSSFPPPPPVANSVGIALKGHALPTGVVNVDAAGTKITRVSGDPFSFNWDAGTPIEIDGQARTITSVTNASELMVTPAVAGAPLSNKVYRVQNAPQIKFTTIQPLGTVEAMGIGVLYEHAVGNVLVGGQCGGNGTGIKLGIATSNNLFLGVTVHQSATNNIYIDANSGRNTFLCPTIYLPAVLGVDNGDRNTIIGVPEINEQKIAGTIELPGTIRFSGTIQSSTRLVGGESYIADAATAGNSVRFWHAGPGAGPTWDTTGSAHYRFMRGGRVELGIEAANFEETSLQVWDQSANTLKRVSRGAPDSGGPGFRVLRIPN